MRNVLSFLVLTMVFTSCSSLRPIPKELTVYAGVSDKILNPYMDEFTKKTGIQVTLIAGDGMKLHNKMQDENEVSKPDVYIEKDLFFMALAKRNDLLLPMKEEVFDGIKNYFRDDENYWKMILYRARVIYYNTKKVKLSDLSTYEALGDKRWRKNICFRSSNNPNNRLLSSYILSEYGEKKTEEIFKSWMKNMRDVPFRTDREAVSGVYREKCLIAVANTYYFGGLLTQDPNASVAFFVPDQERGGAPINGVSIAIPKMSKNIEGAEKLIAFLGQKDIQERLSQDSFQFPTNEEAKWPKLMEGVKAFKIKPVSPNQYINQAREGAELMRKAGYK